MDGVLYCERLGDFEWKETLLEEHFPMMLMFQNSSTFPSASADYREALAGAVKHLAGHGCRELLCLTAESPNGRGFSGANAAGPVSVSPSGPPR